MPLFRQPSKDPLWKDEFSVFTADERHVSRRQLTKFLTLTSLGMFVGNLWILVRSWLYREPAYPARKVLSEGEIPEGGVKLFAYPGPQDQCILVRTSEAAYVAYSQKCTHLSCAVFYAPEHRRLECPFHEVSTSSHHARTPRQRPGRDGRARRSGGRIVCARVR